MNFYNYECIKFELLLLMMMMMIWCPMSQAWLERKNNEENNLWLHIKVRVHHHSISILINIEYIYIYTYIYRNHEAVWLSMNSYFQRMSIGSHCESLTIHRDTNSPVNGRHESEFQWFSSIMLFPMEIRGTVFIHTFLYHCITIWFVWYYIYIH